MRFDSMLEQTAKEGPEERTTVQWRGVCGRGMYESGRTDGGDEIASVIQEEIPVDGDLATAL